MSYSADINPGHGVHQTSIKMQLFLRAQNTHTLEVTGQETVRDIKVHVQTLEGLLVEDQVLLLAGSPLEDASSLVECGISEHCTLEVAGRLLGGQSMTLEGLLVEDQVLLLAGSPLEDASSLVDWFWWVLLCLFVCGVSGISEHCTLEVAGRLLGGKVHGSLARAGKVRGQTPKVDKQEKKKKKTGRAKRRIQYNRRFVNVVPTFGKKKGPNANS
ncbi:hypothetical protein J4Q44_G00346850 [Coregonus suidteri]|uniref:Ubiquitin-like domain-containing protein n=1 Tax=Coregonus suidteri TaxID=861788 RepID=A0AAN8Q8M1_9TELE